MAGYLISVKQKNNEKEEKEAKQNKKTADSGFEHRSTGLEGQRESFFFLHFFLLVFFFLSFFSKQFSFNFKANKSVSH